MEVHLFTIVLLFLVSLLSLRLLNLSLMDRNSLTFNLFRLALEQFIDYSKQNYPQP